MKILFLQMKASKGNPWNVWYKLLMTSSHDTQLWRSGLKTSNMKILKSKMLHVRSENLQQYQCLKLPLPNFGWFTNLGWKELQRTRDILGKCWVYNSRVIGRAKVINQEGVKIFKSWPEMTFFGQHQVDFQNNVSLLIKNDSKTKPILFINSLTYFQIYTW